MECFTEITEFLNRKGENYPELQCDDWVVKLMFLTDITAHLNDLNVRLQGAGHTLLSYYDAWHGFVSKLEIFNADIQAGNVMYINI